jgi:ubiquinone/menaquinone biosynthesis C-methylase UbiE
VSDDRFRRSFDSVAEIYERTRPGYSDEALAWVAQRLPLKRVLDLGAGTGKLTRQLVALGADVVAVEPGDAMRAVLERVVPEAEALAGSAESIPLPDESVDVVTVAQAFHWFRPEEALAEIHRVLRPGGGCALISNDRDDDDPLVHALNVILHRLRPEGTHEGDEAFAAIEATPLFTRLEKRQFPHSDRLDVDEIVGLMTSISAVAAAPPDVRASVEAEVRALVPGSAKVDFRLTTSVVVIDRV